MGLDILREFCRMCEFVFHLAGVNRPVTVDGFESGNIDFTNSLTRILREEKNFCPIVFSSSIQASLDNPYGRSKRRCEEILEGHAAETGADVMIYRLSNVFGKWCRPNYNSVVATFCYQITRGFPVSVQDADHELQLVYIDDVVREFLQARIREKKQEARYFTVHPIHSCTVGELADRLQGFRRCRRALSVPDQGNPFVRKLYSTYLSYLPGEALGYDLNMHTDNRGAFTEFMRTVGQGQFSVNIARPHVVKGNHWHHSKHEKFLVVAGKGVVRLREKGKAEILVCEVSGNVHRVVEIPPGYVHNIENTGDCDMVTVMWASECFDRDHPDTYAEEV